MPAFAPILKRAVKRAGGEAALEKLLPKPKSARQLKAVSDDRYFSLMSRRVFQAGLKQSMVDARWPAFEEVFLGFEPRRVAALPDEEIEKLMGDRRLIRHWGKLRATHHNAAAFVDLSGEKGGFGAYLYQDRYSLRSNLLVVEGFTAVIPITQASRWASFLHGVSRLNATQKARLTTMIATALTTVITSLLT